MKKIVLSLISSTLICFSFPVKSFGIENDFQLWPVIYIRFPIKGKFIGNIETSPRLGDNVTDVAQFRLRPSIGFKLKENFILWQGYVWAPGFIPRFINENRIWQEVQYTTDLFKKLKMTNFFRLEERLIENVNDMSLRGRYTLQFEYALDKASLWQFVLFDKMYFNFYSLAGGPEGGFDQNRLYTGIRRKINDHLSLETGYQFQYLFSNGRAQNRINHAILTSMYLNF